MNQIITQILILLTLSCVYSHATDIGTTQASDLIILLEYNLETQSSSSIEKDSSVWIAFSPFTITTLFTTAPWFYFEGGYNFNDKNAIVAALDFGTSEGTAHFPDFWNPIPFPGPVKNYSIVLGYRRYIWNGFHCEVDLLTGYNEYYESGIIASSGWSGVTAALRIGYMFDLRFIHIPIYASLQAECIASVINGVEAPVSFNVIADQISPILIFPACQIGVIF
jgi:hypothetical protein